MLTRSHSSTGLPEEKGIFEKKSKYDKFGYMMISPYYIFFIVFVALPIIINIGLSFTNYNFVKASFVGLDNYVRVFSDSIFYLSFRNTVIFSVVQLAFALIIGLLVAVLLNNRLFGISFFRTSFFAPHVTSMVAVSMVWLWMYEPSHGMFNTILSVLGIESQKWLFDVDLALGSIIVMSVWKAIGYNAVIYLAGLQGISKDLYEAASVDGANMFHKLFYITVPMLKPISFFLIVTGFINNFNVFEQIQVMTKGGPMNSTTTVVHQIYTRGFAEFQMGYAAAMSMVLLVLIAGITLLNFKFSKGHDG